MDYDSMTAFLSEENIKRHLSYLNSLKLKYSILEKSIPALKGLEGARILKSGLSRKDITDAFSLYCEIYAHKKYFSSFTKTPKPSLSLRKHYRSENNFCYALRESVKAGNYRYAYVYLDKRARPEYRCIKEPDQQLLNDNPILLLDLCEHSYFLDYGYEFEKYLTSSIAHLDFSRLDDINNP